jgi:hypothetical protein
MEPRIATLLDQQHYRRLTLDPSVLTAPSSVAPRHVELSSGLSAGRAIPDSQSHHDYVDTRHKAVSQVHSSAPLARVLNDSAYSSPSFQSSPVRSRPQHATFRTRSDIPASGLSATSPDAPRRDEQPTTTGYPAGDISLIQLPKPPQAPRRTAKRPRIPPLLQGLHQPPPLPPKNKLFPPISERSGPGDDVGDRFGLTSTLPISSTDASAKARASPEERNKPASVDVGQTEASPNAPVVHGEQGTSGEVTNPSPAIQTADRPQPKGKTTRKRTKWSQKETEDLLIGVSRYGIGRWKQILECADFNFQGRTAVDLKDRFRVCRPGEGLKARKGAMAKASTSLRSTDTGPAPASAGNTATESITPAQEISTEDRDTNDANASKPNDVYGPFMKSQRRARREFSDEDDRNLLKGFKRHGSTWHAMRDDLELGFGMRHATDLRDRFRIRYPEQFAKAGYKLKPKEARALQDAEEKAHASDHPVSHGGIPMASASAPAAPALAAAAAPASPHPTSQRPLFDPALDFTLDSDSDSQTPIVLNRNILQWADLNPSSLPPSTSTSTCTALHSLPATDALAQAEDGMHINPLATLKLPTAHWGYVPSSLPHSLTHALPPPAPLKLGLHGNNARSQCDMRTPNLPNIVFPYVPSASARGAVLNLPAPADILSERQG